MTLHTGTRLGAYEIVAAIGAGGMGEVYKALDTRLNRSVAIKVLPGHISGDPEAKARFDREAQTIAGLKQFPVYKNRPYTEFLFEGLRKAGLPEE